MKVLHVSSCLEVESGGPSMAAAGLVCAQLHKNMSVGIALMTSPTSDPSLPQDLLNRGAQVVRLGPLKQNLRLTSTMKRVLHDTVRTADIIHIHALWESIQHHAAVAARRNYKPYIFRPCGMLDPYSLSHNWLLKKFYMHWRLRRNLNNAAAIHYTAEAEKEGAGALKLRPPAIVEPNGVDLDAYQNLPPRGAFRQKFNIPHDQKIVLFVGRIHPVKGLDLLIPAFARAQQLQNNDAVLVLVGPEHQDYRATIESLIATHHLQDRVIWTGMLQGNDKVQAYVDADLFALPSYHENFGIVVAEAMAAGLPVIISDKVNLDRDVLACGAGGVVPTQVEPLAEAIVQWLGDQQRRASAGLAGRKYAFERFSWDSIAKRWQGHYEEIIRKHQSLKT